MELHICFHTANPDRPFVLSCDNKAFKKLMSNFGSSRSEESCSAVVELLERVTRLHKELESREGQEEVDQVQTTTDLTSHQGGLLECALP